MPQPVDIPIPVDLQDLMKIPPCFDLRLPEPVDLQVRLPTGAVLKAVNDISKGIPTDCAASFNLLLQLGPLLASMECLLKMLKVLKPLIDVIKGLPFPPVKAIQDFIEAAADLATCFNVLLPTNLLVLVHDILCLIAKMLKCIAGGLKTIIDVMSGAALQLKIAVDTGNTELQRSLECAQENAATSAQHLMSSLEPLAALLALLEPIMGLAGLEPFKFPAIGKETDVESLKVAQQAIQGIADSMETVAIGIGGPCS